jgi:hypothetical protein
MKRRFIVTLSEIVNYRVEVEAEDRDAAADAAHLAFLRSDAVQAVHNQLFAIRTKDGIKVESENDRHPDIGPIEEMTESADQVTIEQAEYLWVVDTGMPVPRA